MFWAQHIFVTEFPPVNKKKEPLPYQPANIRREIEIGARMNKIKRKQKREREEFKKERRLLIIFISLLKSSPGSIHTLNQYTEYYSMLSIWDPFSYKPVRACDLVGPLVASLKQPGTSIDYHYFHKLTSSQIMGYIS